MALPGVKTVLKDRFYTLSRTDIPDGIRVVAIARRGDVSTGSDEGTGANYDPFTPRSEREVIDTFGENSELHRAYLELVSGGAARVTLIALPSDTADSDLTSTADGNPFDTAFEAAEAVQPDIIVPWGRGGHPYDWDNYATPNETLVGFAADNSAAAATSLAKRVADKCKEITDRSHPVFAVMGIAPQLGTTENIVPADLTTHFTLPNLIDHDGSTIGDNGSYVSVIASEMKTVGYPEAYGYSNGAAVYAGFLSSLAGEIAATGRKLHNISALRYTPTRPQQEALIAKGVTPVGQDFARQAVLVDALTFGKETSDYSRLSTLRIVFDAIQLVRNAASNFVGMPASLHNRNALETAISSSLRNMMINGALINADFVVTYAPRESTAFVDLVLQPAFELRNIEVSISVQL